MYYASRTLPNFFAFGLVTIGLGGLLQRPRVEPYLYMSKAQLFLSLVTITGVIFRSELALFLIPHTLVLLVTRRLNVACIVKFGLLGALIGLSITVPIDSFFWQRFPLWPELSAFSYNILHSQSSNWGTSPWYFYFTSALPRLLFNPITYTLCIPLAASQPALRRPVTELVLPNLAFVALYSLQPHKEWRFIIYTIPPFLTAAALGANWIWTRRAKSPLYRLLASALVLSVIASFAASGIMLAISRLNYPGADALHRLHALVPLHQHQPYLGGQGGEQRLTVNVHMGTLACMTGITRFQQQQQQQQQQQPPPAPPPLADLEKNTVAVERSAGSDFFFIYDKTDNETKLLDPLFWLRFDWALAEYPERVIGKWEVVDTVEAYAGLEILRPDAEDEKGDGGGGGGIMDVVKMVKQREWNSLERYARMVTAGWWVRVRMEPRISILKRQRDDGPVVLPPLGGGDW
ncbi:Dol-P-Man:Man(7)GlcNAc(2)-PP-Dol alpha-1,6-mannosyltransferase [Xanthoria parietina]